MIDEEGRNLLMIISTPRAGSSLLGAMLGSHGKVLCPPETWILLTLTAMHSENAHLASHEDTELARRAVADAIDASTFASLASEFASRFFNHLLREAGKDVFVERTPRNYRILNEISAWFPAARMIWLRRNPLDVVASMKDSWGVSVLEAMGKRLTSYSFDATIAYAEQVSFFRADRTITTSVRYEDLVCEPKQVMRGIAAFCGLDFEDKMLEYGANQLQLDALKKATMGDKKLLQHRSPHSNSIGRWQEILSNEEAALVLGVLGRELFHQLGYEDEFARTARWIQETGENIPTDFSLADLYESYRQLVDRGFLRAGGPQHLQVVRQNESLIQQIEWYRDHAEQGRPGANA
jgi:hypothetical protein